MFFEEVVNGKKFYWVEFEISGKVRSLSVFLWLLIYLIVLYLSDNFLF